MTSEMPESRHQVVGVVDVGSNSIKLTVATLDSTGSVKELAAAAETVRLGSGLGATGRLAEDRIEAAVDALGRFAEIGRQHGATEFVGVATDATRRAANGEAFLQRIRDETGWSVVAIDGDREAELTFRGVASQGDFSGLVVIADIGGGSTELIVARDMNILDARSLAIGSGTLTETFLNSNPPTDSEIAEAAASVSATLATMSLPHEAPTRLVAVGGTAEYLARMIGSDSQVDISGINQALVTCQEIPSPELARQIAIPEARARVLPAGIVVIRELSSLLGTAGTEVTASGIRMGLLLETFERLAEFN